MFPDSQIEFNRREFLSLLASSMAMAGLSGCASATPEKIVPYVRAPEDLLPGAPQFFSTAMPSRGYGIGLIAKSHQGRPIKIEGNPDHPASLGATDVFAQASLLTLYDPDRSQTVTQAGAISTWDAFITNLKGALAQYASNGGDGLRILTETVASPALASLINNLLKKYPNARWHQYEPVNRDNARAGAKAAFGRYVDTIYRFEDADVIVSLDCDFLTSTPGSLRYAREFARRRKMTPGDNRMNRLYVLESSLTITGAKADHRLRIRSSDVLAMARAIEASDSSNPLLKPLIEDLAAHHGRSIVIAGDEQPAEVHALVHVINDRLGNVGKTVSYIEPVEANPVEHTESLRELVSDMDANRVSTLVIMSGNPVYTAPADFEFATRLLRVPLRIHHSIYFEETSQVCDWHIPESHFLESWGDIRAYNGTTSITQPLIVPLYDTKTSYELLSAMLGDPTRSNYELVHGYWQSIRKDADFDRFWNLSLQKGVLSEELRQPVRADKPSQPTSSSVRSEGGLEVVFRPDPTIFDGRWANNAWLQELPKPITTLTWDNAALVSPDTAAKLTVKTGDIVELTVGAFKQKAGVQVWPGVADDSITVHLGYGRTRSGPIGLSRGFNAYRIRSSTASSIATGVSVRKTGLTTTLATTQGHHELDKRHIARSLTADEYSQHPDDVRNEERSPAPSETLYPPHQPIDYAWGMTVDLSACIGCNACVIACQSENNVPAVGKDQVARGREMHWLRIDAYTAGDPQNPEIRFEPMLCQHCENAPCELVCPVEATSHSAEGINEMTYNRCVGTRYCSNNCPYKVRRFNFYQFTEWNIPQFKMLYNPDVTVRSRGVMEKCTYCVQRINRARINAKVDDRKIREGEVVTACQQVCPAEAITFGNLLNPNSAVTKSKAEPRQYGVLEELNTRPRTTYLARLRNPKP